MFNLAQIFTVNLTSQEKMIQVKVRHFDSNQKLKIQFQNYLMDCDIVESNSSCRYFLLPSYIYI